jgi:TFIIF-interacting CTD phosphatase-like protein
VLDLDETLAHASNEMIVAPDMKFLLTTPHGNAPVYVRFRPYAKEFIEQMAQYYELVVFTASLNAVFLFLTVNI